MHFDPMVVLAHALHIKWVWFHCWFRCSPHTHRPNFHHACTICHHAWICCIACSACV